jgi:hypothetical protein
MSNFEIVHYTSKKNIDKMLFSGRILNNVAVKKMRSPKIEEGEGGFERVLCEPDVFENGFDKRTECEEAFGIYCRIKNIHRPFISYSSRDYAKNLKLPQRGKVAIIFHSYILNDYTWHFNYCENNGFYISKTPKGLIAPFGVGKCYAETTKQIHNIEHAIDNNRIENYPDTELVIRESIDLYKENYIKDIIDHTGNSILYKYKLHKSRKSRTRRISSVPTSSKTRTRTKTRTKSRTKLRGLSI